MPKYGVRYTVSVGRYMRVVTKEKFFTTHQARTKWCEKAEKQSNFLEFVAWAEPRQEAEHGTA